MNRNEKFLDDDGYKINWGALYKRQPAGITLSDEKIPVDVNNDFIADYYKADIVSAQDYYPFGMLMPERNFSTSKYTYSFNGKLRDDNVYGKGNFYNYGFRMYDSRLGRFMSVDPLTKKYASWTPYAFAQDRVIDGIDLEGLEYIRSTIDLATGQVYLEVTSAKGMKEKPSQDQQKVVWFLTNKNKVTKKLGVTYGSTSGINAFLNKDLRNIAVGRDKNGNPIITKTNIYASSLSHNVFKEISTNLRVLYPKASDVQINDMSKRISLNVSIQRQKKKYQNEKLPPPQYANFYYYKGTKVGSSVRGTNAVRINGNGNSIVNKVKQKIHTQGKKGNNDRQRDNVPSF